MISTFDTIFVRELRAKIEERRAELTDSLAHGRGVGDWSEYRHKLGQMKALEETLVHVEEIRARLMGEDRRASDAA